MKTTTTVKDLLAMTKAQQTKVVPADLRKKFQQRKEVTPEDLKAFTTYPSAAEPLVIKVSVRWHVFLGVVGSAESAQNDKGKGRDTNSSHNSHNGANLSASFPESGQVIQTGQGNDGDPDPSTQQPWSELGHQSHPLSQA